MYTEFLFYSFMILCFSKLLKKLDFFPSNTHGKLQLCFEFLSICFFSFFLTKERGHVTTKDFKNCNTNK